MHALPSTSSSRRQFMAGEVIVARILHLGRASHEWPSPTGTSHADQTGKQALLGEHQAHDVKKGCTATFSQKNFQNVGGARIHALVKKKFDALAEQMARKAISRRMPHLGMAEHTLPVPADSILGDRESELGSLSEHNPDQQPEHVSRNHFPVTGASRDDRHNRDDRYNFKYLNI